MRVTTPWGCTPTFVRALQPAHPRMLRDDLRGYVLLGDPAARLSLRGS